MGRSYVAVGRCHDGIGIVEGDAGILLEEDEFSQRKAKQLSRMDGRWVGWMWLMAWSKARAMRQMLMEWQVVPNHRRVPERVYGGSKAWMVNVKGVVLGRGQQCH